MKILKRTWNLLVLLLASSTMLSLESNAAEYVLSESSRPQLQEPVKKPKVQTSALPEHTTVYVIGKSAKKAVPMNSPKRTGKLHVAAEGKRKKSNKASAKVKTNTFSKRYMALKTNIAYDAFALLNLSFETQIHSNLSVELPIVWSLWDMEQQHGVRGVVLQPELRWYPKLVGEGHYLGLHTDVAWYNVKWEDNRYQDTGRPLLGAGLSYGYKLPLGEHWGMEFSLGAGYVNMQYDTFYNIDNGAKLDTRNRHYWGITRVGASLVYRF